MRIGGLIAGLCLLAQGLQAQDLMVAARLDTAHARVGDPIALKLTLAFDEAMRPDMPDLPHLLSAFNPRCADWSREVGPAGVQMEQQCQLRLYELGPHQLPAIEVAFVSAAGDTLLRSSEPLEIEIISARGEGDEELRDIKPPLAISGGIPLWVAVVLALVLLALVGLFVYWIWRRRRGSSELATPEAKPINYAAEFNRIAGLGLLDRGDFKTFYSLLSENLRRFLEDRLEIEAMEQTTSELAAALRGAEIENRLAQQIIEYLGAADLVKFARFYPDLDAARRAPDAGLALLQDVEELIATRRQATEDHAEHPV